MVKGVTRFPPRPASLHGRARELRVLARLVSSRDRVRVALVGPGGSGKSVLACALGHAVAAHFGGRLEWFRIGDWDARTVAEMLALRFGTSRERGRLFPALRARLNASLPTLIVLDNHENDAAMVRLLSELGDTPATFVLTARRCLMTGVSLFPVHPPLATEQRAAFSRVAKLTKMLRYNPLALDIADAIVRSRAATVQTLVDWLVRKGVSRVRVAEHEDDVPEVSLLVDWAWQRLPPEARRMMAVLAYVGGDHSDAAAVGELSRSGHAGARALASLARWHLVQQPLQGRYALHAVIRHRVRQKTRFDEKRLVRYYLDRLEREPDKLELEQTHLFYAMDWVQRQGDLSALLRIERMLAYLAPVSP
jgi:hypothetical protein